MPSDSSFTPRTIHVLGTGKLADAISFGLQQWGHTIFRLIQLDSINTSIETLWIAIDTPVTAYGVASLKQVSKDIYTAVGCLQPGMLAVISSQVPVGFNFSLRQQYPLIDIVTIPEYLRRNKEIVGFLQPDFIVIGATEHVDKEDVISLYHESLHSRILWMSPESAEMSKQAINTFLGMSIIFANEIASLCEKAQANYVDVERVLRQEPRIGKTAYVGAGKADGSHFLRDIRYLDKLRDSDQPSLLPELLSLWQ